MKLYANFRITAQRKRANCLARNAGWDMERLMDSIERTRKNFVAFVRLEHTEVVKSNQNVNHAPLEIPVLRAQVSMDQVLDLVQSAITAQPLMHRVYQYRVSQEHIHQLKEQKQNHANPVLKIPTLILKDKQRVDLAEQRPYQKRTLANASA